MQLDTRSSTVSPRSVVLIAMIAFAAGLRVLNGYGFFPGALPYNFTPVEAIALFGGAYFLDRRLAFLVPLAAMLLGDLVMASRLKPEWIADWMKTLPAVYGCIALTVFGGFGLRNKVSALGVAGYSLASAVLFFLVTNFATWLTANPVEGGAACTQSLAACYVAGLPFFKGTLYGTLFWSAVLFGGFELMRRHWPSLQPAHA